MRRHSGYSTAQFSFGPGPITPGVKLLLWANVGVFALTWLVQDVPWYQVFGLVPTAVLGKLHIWQPVTYLFLHGGFWHILMNMFVLWMFGVSLERSWGTDFFLRFYFLVGIGAGLATWLFMLSSSVPTIGASGATVGILVAFAMMYPNQPIYFALLFPIPAKYFVMIYAALEFMAARSYTSDGIGHVTHLAGMAIGFVYLKADWRPGLMWRRLKKRLQSRHLRVVRFEPRAPREDLDEAEIDAILDKISREGIDSLTEAEVRKLRERSRR